MPDLVARIRRPDHRCVQPRLREPAHDRGPVVGADLDEGAQFLGK